MCDFPLVDLRFILSRLTRPLFDVRVIDTKMIILGPYATQQLGDLGVDIVKIEATGAGDLIRNAGPKHNDGIGGILFNVNRKKWGVVLDLK